MHAGHLGPPGRISGIGAHQGGEKWGDGKGERCNFETLGESMTCTNTGEGLEQTEIRSEPVFRE